MPQLLPEWYPQEAILLAWPDQFTDWEPWLDDVRSTYFEIIEALNCNSTPVLMLIREEQIENCQKLIQSLPNNNVDQLLLIPAHYNDTWLRDYGFLTCQTENGMQAVNFTFNGWGNKFNAQRDNFVNGEILNTLLKVPLKNIDFVLEGGALEIDANGHLLSTQLCLANPQRNGEFNLAEHQKIFETALGAKQISILQNGHLEGDDTDGHIDTLVRFTPNNALVIQSCFNRPDDSHFDGLQALVNECKESISPAGIYELPLPFIINKESERLPASYANYLISNNQILAPIYGEAEDDNAIEALKAAYPQFTILPVDCRSLVQQFGSLHCITMQVPCGTLKSEVIDQARSGISIFRNQIK